MPVRLEILEPQRLIIANGRGTVTVADLERYLDDIYVANLLSYAKLVDLSEGEIRLTDNDLMMLGARIRAYVESGQVFGPLAIVVRSTDREVAQLYRALAGADRPARVFTNPLLARRWLNTHP